LQTVPYHIPEAGIVAHRTVPNTWSRHRCKPYRTVPEAGIVANANLNVVLRHLALESLLEGENGGVNGILRHMVGIRVSDPHWFNADPDTNPDPAFFLIADPDSGFRIRIPDPDPGFDDLKLKKIYN
jgi:hypothetical protein